MDDVDKVQDIIDRVERRKVPRGNYYRDKFDFTERTPYASKADDIKPGKRGSPNGVVVYYRCLCGKMINLGAPSHNGTLDDPKFVECGECGAHA